MRDVERSGLEQALHQVVEVLGDEIVEVRLERDDAIRRRPAGAPEHRAQHVGQRARAGRFRRRVRWPRSSSPEARRTRRPRCAGSRLPSVSPSPSARARAPSECRAAARASPARAAAGGRAPSRRCRRRAPPREAVTRVMPRRSRPIAAPATSTIASTAPTSWKWTRASATPWTAASARPSASKIASARSRTAGRRRARSSSCRTSR